MPKNIKPKEPAKPKLAVFKFASCDGCQLSLLDAEDALLAVAGAVEIAYFVEARDRRLPGPYDVTLVEGSISTATQIDEIKEIRRQSNFPDRHRRLRHSGRHPIAAQLARCGRLHQHRLRQPLFHRYPGYFDAYQ